MIKEQLINEYTGCEQLSLSELKKLIEEQGIKMIRLEYLDILGINRTKLMPVSMLEEICHEGIPFAACIMALGYDNNIVESDYINTVYDDLKVIGDLSTFRILSHTEKTALLIGDVYYHEKPMEHSPRSFLKKIVDKYHALGLEPIAASELEFYVHKKTEDGSIVPYVNQPCMLYQANTLVDPKGFLNQLTDSLHKMNFEILYMNHEYYQSQYEYNWKHGPVVRTADENALFKGLSKELADQNDLKVTFMAKPKGAPGGSGCHFHLSFNCLESGKNLCEDTSSEDGLSDIMRHFIGGVYKHIMGLTPLLAPTVNCYKRYQPNSFAPIYLSWGYDNRTAYIRIPNERGKATRMEVRAGSAAANSYLALGAILAAGLDGIENKIEPPKPITTDIYNDKSLDLQQLPSDLSDAIEELKSDKCLVDAMGVELFDVFYSLKKKEVDDYRRYVTDWEWSTYSYHV